VPSAAWAVGSVQVSNGQGTAVADPEYATELTVTGSGFQSIQGGFGGVYVLFGWVDDAAGGGWKPSNGGAAGTEYRYVPDSEAKDNGGFQRFVAFPGSETEASAQAVMTGTGGWSVSIVVPGARFESLDRSGGTSMVDCLSVQCGIITIGAHGVKNPNNETFTPIEFVAPATEAAPAPAAAGLARVGYSAASAVAGKAMTFTAQGFTPGEQVVASLDNGLVAVGPLVAGVSGEIAGVLSLPADLRAGTHLLTLTGAGSGQIAETEVTVTGGQSPLVVAPDDGPEAAWPYVLLGVACLIALVLVLTSIVTSIVRARRRRVRTETSVPGAVPDTVPDTPAGAVSTEDLDTVPR
jgi:hypothetical protein